MSQDTAAGEPVRIGLIGLDTSHVIAFTQIFNNPDNPEHVPGVRVVAAYPGGSPDLPASIDRVPEYTRQLRDEFGVEIVDSIEELCQKVDGICIESVDGRPHLEQAKPVIAAGLPFFIDKPMAGSFADAKEIAQLAKDAGVPWFGGSSLRWVPSVVAATDPEVVGDILGCDAFSPCALEEHHPDLFWYGVHGVEILYAAMGAGCQTVTRVETPDTDMVVGVWEGGRIGTYRGMRAGAHDYGCTAFGTKGITKAQGHTYKGLLEAIATFFQTKQAPLPAEEMLEVIAFMQAADDSKAAGGAAVPVPDCQLR